MVNSKEFDSGWHQKFEQFRRSIPQPLPDHWKPSARLKGKFIDLKLLNRNNWESSENRPIFFSSNRLISSDGNQLFKNKEDFLHLRFERCLLYTSDAADDSLRVDLGGRRIIKKF